VLSNPKIEMHWNSETIEILGNEAGVNEVQIRNVRTLEQSSLKVTGFFVAIGHSPNTQIFKGIIDMNDSGYILTVPGTSRTNVPGVFASGDAQDNVYRQAVTAAGTGCMAALDAERYLAEQELH
jgi:thioredoxin reductase (NADPH)